MLHFLAALVIIAGTTFGTTESLAATGPQRLTQGAAQPQPAGKLTHDFFVGAWTTRNVEFGRDVEIVWTLWRDGTLAYRFAVDGIPFEGSRGTWVYDGTLMHEQWDRPDGTVGAGRGSVEWIDNDTIRLTIVDNGDPTYRGMSRVYRRTGPAQLSLFRH